MMTKQEILKLHELSEEGQIQWLREKEIIPIDIGGILLAEFEIESLADCAFRLRDEVLEKYGEDAFEKPANYMANITHTKVRWSWSLYSEPIHWIQAALLARLENENG